jgi:cAMP-dependent protein kinase regulator
MDTNFELDADQQKIKSQIFPYLKSLTYEILMKKPDNIASFMIDFLSRQGNYTTSGLTFSEKKELENLRTIVKRYRELETFNKTQEENSDSEDDNEDLMNSSDEEKIENQVKIMKNNPKSQFKKNTRNSVSAEVYGIFNKKKIFVPKKIHKTEEQINRIKGKIISSFIFSSLDKKEIEIVIDAMEEKKFKIDEKVITQGEVGDCLYIVETGSLSCYKILESGENKFLCNYGPGDAFGELALLYNCPRAASIICSSDESILWALDRETFNQIVKTAAQNKREKYENFLKQVDILSTIDSYELGKICDSLKVGIFKKDDYIIKEGEFGDVFYIIEEGKCKATKTLEPGKPEEIINELKEGDYFGERALLRGEPRYANIVVVSDTAKVISLDRLSFNRLLGPIMDILKRNMDKYTAYCQPNNNGKLTNLKDILSSDNNIKDAENNRNNVIEINKNEDINEINEENDKDINKNIDSQINVNNNLNELIKSDNMINNNNNDSIEIQKENIIEEKDDIINEEKKEDNIESNNNDNQNGQNNLNSLQEMIVSKDNNDESPKNDEQ